MSEMTPRVRHFFNVWFVAQTGYGYLKCGKAPDIRQEDYMLNLENRLADYNQARVLRDEAHPDAHLMLMLTVKGGWLARWRAEIKGAKLWKYQSERFEADYQDFMRFYRMTHELND
ncbi:MAG: hypothetical protein KGJ10_02960 [Acidobacteriota bacterium]|nr:hypothetical protein [Acidobacteriota bacterium]MDE3043773.1 hypothetical protein [Acidobacteriota bacterium]